jgi:hypothetical protein
MRVWLVVFFTTLFLFGCKTTDPIYYYGEYPKAVYSYFNVNDVSVSQQITILEGVVEQAGGNNKPVPPGLHAHLGMLYFEAGNTAQGLTNFEQEKALFPESVAYIDFLINNMAGVKI